MTINTTWSVNNMTHMDADGGVIEVRWQCRAQNDDGPESAVDAGEYKCTYDPSAPGFIRYDDLTEPDVLSWVWDSLPEDNDKAAIEANRTERVEAQIERNATEETGVPWAA